MTQRRTGQDGAGLPAQAERCHGVGQRFASGLAVRQRLPGLGVGAFGQQQAGFLEAFAQRGDVQAGGLFRAQSGLVQPGQQRFGLQVERGQGIGAAVGRVELAARKDMDAAQHAGVGMAAQQQHLESGTAVAQQHQGGGVARRAFGIGSGHGAGHRIQAGVRPDSGEVVEAGQGQIEGLAGFVAPAQAGLGADAAQAGYWSGGGAGGLQQGLARRGGGGEDQLVVVAAG